MLAAEPVFHKQTPSGVEGVAVPFGHTSTNLPELLENFTENAAAYRPVQMQAPAGVMVKLARSQTTQDTAAAVIQVVGGQFQFQRYGHISEEGSLVLMSQGVLQVLHPPFGRAIVAGITRRTVEGQHQVLLQHRVDRQAVER